MAFRSGSELLCSSCGRRCRRAGAGRCVVRRGESIAITFDDVDPDRPLAAVKAVVNSYQSLYGDTNDGSNERRLELLQRMALAGQTDLEIKQRAIDEYSRADSTFVEQAF